MVRREAYGLERYEKLQHRISDAILDCLGRLFKFLCDFKIGHSGKERQFYHSVLEGRDCLQRRAHESPLFGDIYGGVAGVRRFSVAPFAEVLAR
jgi:hypothetical protein